MLTVKQLSRQRPFAMHSRCKININDFIECTVNVRISLTVHYCMNLDENCVNCNMSSIDVALDKLNAPQISTKFKDGNVCITSVLPFVNDHLH